MSETPKTPARAVPQAQWLDQAWQFLSQADALLVAAGAGLGVDSGLPDFRGTNGLWRRFPGVQKAGLGFVDIANPRALRDDPTLAWGFYGERLLDYRAVQPHTSFGHMLRWGLSRPKGVAVFTSNVDGHFQKAGFPEHLVMECHGSLHHLQCARPCTPAIWPADGWLPEVDRTISRLTSALPSCPHCGGLARPNVLMFDDGQWVEDRTQAQGERLLDWLAQARRGVVLEIGAGTAVASVRSFTRRQQQKGWQLVRVNPEASGECTPDAVQLPMRGADFFAAMAEREATGRLP